MNIVLIVGGIVVALVVGVAVTLYCIRVDRSLLSRAQVQLQQRRAEAEVQRLVQESVQRMFDAARRFE